MYLIEHTFYVVMDRWKSEKKEDINSLGVRIGVRGRRWERKR
jgi:hypothetical protein